MNPESEVFAGLAARPEVEADNDSETQVAIYARTSSTTQQFGYSIDEQVRRCWERCQLLNWTVSYVFRDEAKSGKNPDRPMFQNLLEQAEQGTFEVVVFWKLDRFSRSIMHAVQLEKQFRDWGVALHSVTEQIDTTTPAGQFNFRNIANAAEFERELIKQRTKMGHAALAAEHKWPNSLPPLGYDRMESGALKTNPSEAILVRLIFKSYLVRRSMPLVAKMLNNKGLLTKEGNEWNEKAVSSILRNPIYMGLYTIGSIEERVSEYQVVSEELFEEVTKVRMRFQNSKSSKETRRRMGHNRKERRVSRISNQYLGFLSET